MWLYADTGRADWFIHDFVFLFQLILKEEEKANIEQELAAEKEKVKGFEVMEIKLKSLESEKYVFNCTYKMCVLIL